MTWGENIMTVYNYYAVITKDKQKDDTDYTYLVTFPDLQNVFTAGDSLQHAITLAEDVLALMLAHFEDEGQTFAAPSSFAALKDNVREESTLALIEVDTHTYREKL